MGGVVGSASGDREDSTGRPVSRGQSERALEDLRALVARFANAMTDLDQQHGRAEEALQQLSAHLARADGPQYEIQQLTERMAVTYEELRDRTTSLCQAERAAGIPPERAVVLLKGVVDHGRSAGLTDHAASIVERDVVTWGIQGYYSRVS